MLKFACLFLVFLSVVAHSNAAPGQAVWGQQDTLSALVGQIVQTHSSAGASSGGGGPMNHGSGYETSNSGPQRFGGNGHNTGANHGGPRGGGGGGGYEPNCSGKLLFVVVLHFI